jgi:hypothetical protein
MVRSPVDIFAQTSYDIALGFASGPSCMTLDEARRELARMARRKECRIVEWTRVRPCDWRPTQVLNPESGLLFTEIGAWEYIADLLDANHPLTELALEQPPGEIAYTMAVSLGPKVPKLYIKLQILRGRVLARSFHYSDR